MNKAAVKENKKRKVKKPFYKKWQFWFFLIIFIGALNSEPPVEESHIYDTAQVVELMNGLGTEVVGEYSVIEADSSEVTHEALEDWYFNYVCENDYNYCVIVYTDKAEPMGAYSFGSHVEEGLKFQIDENGVYYYGDNTESTIYVAKDGHLEEFSFN